MCGIWAIFGLHDNALKYCGTSFPKIKHRGPDAWRIEYDNRIKNCCVGFHRLSIVDCTYGMQPMTIHQFPYYILLCNGELYNCKRLAEEFDFKYETLCDVECILHLYDKFGIEGCVKNLDGVFAFCLVDLKRHKVVLGRDPYGVRPMFCVTSSLGVLAICSEAKGLVSFSDELNGDTKDIEPFPPGTYAEYSILEDGKTKLLGGGSFHGPGDKPAFRPFVMYGELSSNDVLGNIRKLFSMAVKKRLMADRRIGCLLSGGLDSSLTASLLVTLAKEAKLPYKIQSFSVGMGDSPDIIAARQVAEYIGTEHYEVIFTEEDVAKVLDDVIYSLETPDITTIRASIGMYIVSKFIKENTETTVVFSGEGSDEIAQGYIYFRDAPSADEALEDSKRLLRELYLYDVLRGDRTMSSQSLELRVPFLDQQFVHYYLNLPKQMLRPKDGVEKHLLRSAFAETEVLPDNILWRHKEAFSDGVTSRAKSLFEILQEIVEKRMPEEFDAESAAVKYPHCTPKTKEAYYYREIFEKSYPKLAEKFIPYFWMPRWSEATDPSARFIKHYSADKETKKS